MELLTVSQVAVLLGRSTGRIRELIREGKLKATQLESGEYVITREDFEVFKATPRKRGRPKKPTPPNGPPVKVEIDPRSRIAIKDKRPKLRNQSGGVEGEIPV